MSLLSACFSLKVYNTSKPIMALWLANLNGHLGVDICCLKETHFYCKWWEYSVKRVSPHILIVIREETCLQHVCLRRFRLHDHEESVYSQNDWWKRAVFFCFFFCLIQSFVVPLRNPVLDPDLHLWNDRKNSSFHLDANVYSLHLIDKFWNEYLKKVE